MNSLKMSGTYKCAATIPNQHEQRYRAFSSEFAINVVGIEPLRVISSRLPLNKNGEINLEVSENFKLPKFILSFPRCVRTLVQKFFGTLLMG